MVNLSRTRPHVFAAVALATLPLPSWLLNTLPTSVAAVAQAHKRPLQPPLLCLRPLAAPVPDDALPFGGGAPDWQDAPYARLAGTDPRFAAQLWLTQSRAGVHVAVEVLDAHHENTRREGQIWDGDAVQLALHPFATGERAGELVGEEAGPDDLLLTLALTDAGDAAWAHRAASGADRGAWPHPVAVVRDESHSVTRYEALIPWSALNATPGSLDQMGLSLWVLDGNTAPRTRAAASNDVAAKARRLRYGASAAGGVRPSEMATVTLAPPPEEFAAVGAPRPALHADAEGFACTLSGARARAPAVARAPLQVVLRCGPRTLATLPWSVRGRAQLMAWPQATGCPEAQGDPNGTTYALQLRDAHGTVHAERILVPTGLHAKLREAKTALAASAAQAAQAAVAASPHEASATAHEVLAAAEAASLGGLLHGLEASLQGRGAIDKAAETVSLAELADAVTAAYRPAAGRAEALRQGKQGYLLTLRSAQDGSMQPYVLVRPQGARRGGHCDPSPPLRALPSSEASPLSEVLPSSEATPSSAAPLVVWLHGRGAPSLAQFVQDAVHEAPPEGRGLSEAWLLLPWARGNLGAVGVGQDDVLSALADVVRQVPIDRDRIYLGGHSLGGTGAMALALHRPELWAAVAVASGGTWWSSLGRGLGRNVAQVPFFIWHGLADGAVDSVQSRRLVAELTTYGVPHEAHFAPGMGHAMPAGLLSEIESFYHAKRRPHLRAWRFVADGPQHRTSRGLSLAVDAAQSAYPWVDVARPDAHTLQLDAHQTQGLEVDLNAADLDLEGEVSVRYQGHEVYRGPKVSLSLGEGAPRP